MKTEERKVFIINCMYFAILLAAAFAILKYGLPMVTPFVTAFVIAYLLKGPICFLSGRLHLNQKVTAILLVLLLSLIHISSVAAWLLKQQGYDVIGVTMQIWQDEDTDVQEAEGGCCGLSAVDDARRVAMDLGIPYYVMNFREEFRKNVMDYFVGEYVEGKTPNPCIACNRYVKWESLSLIHIS